LTAVTSHPNFLRLKIARCLHLVTINCKIATKTVCHFNMSNRTKHFEDALIQMEPKMLLQFVGPQPKERRLCIGNSYIPPVHVRKALTQTAKTKNVASEQHRKPSKATPHKVWRSMHLLRLQIWSCWQSCAN